jgi:hypothetical protein
MKISVKKSLKLLTLLISSLLIASVSAAAYVTLQWQATATVSANPKVCFIQWSNGQKANTFSYSVNIFPSIKTVDENVSYGIWVDDDQTHTVYFRLAGHNTNTTDIAKLNYTIWNSAEGQKYTYQSTTLDTSWSGPITLSANTKYTIWIEITAGASAGVGHSPTLTFEMKVVNP